MNNPRITPKDRGLIKGAMRRAFSRSTLRQEVIAESIIQHTDTSRPRVKTWCQCAVCKKPNAKSSMVADHVEPVIPVNSSMEEMSLDELANRMWCDKKNLQSICEVCHDAKTRLEMIARKQFKKEKRDAESKTIEKPVKKRSTRVTTRTRKRRIVQRNTRNNKTRPRSNRKKT